MRYLFLFLVFACYTAVSYSQSSMPSSIPSHIIDKLKSKFDLSQVEKIEKEYDEADETTRAIMLSVYSMPLSNKKELVENFEKKQEEILDLKNTFERMIPEGLIVFLELKESAYSPGMIKAIDLQVYKKDEQGELDMIDGDWDMVYGSEELDDLLEMIDWDRMTLLALKNIMQTANCISIQNGDYTEIGFVRSGLGKYFYDIFTDNLSQNQINTYNDGCEYIYYKDNIVLRYVGGMAGPQCFMD